MKPFALMCLCLFGLTFSAGCGGSAEPVPEETAAESQSVDQQISGAGMTDADYEKSMQENYKQQQGQ